MKAAGAVALILLLVVESAAAFRWPWDQPRHHIGRRLAQEPAHPPDCAQINEAVRTLEPERRARALRSTTADKRAVIEKCAERAR